MKKSIVIFVLLVAMLISADVQAAKVYVAAGPDRDAALGALMAANPLPDLAGKKVAIKANFNSADPFPASTNLNTLEYVIKHIKAMKPASIVLPERSGMGDTRKVLESMGAAKIAEKYGVSIMVLDELEESGWKHIPQGKSHWPRGYPVARVFLDADYVVNLPCLKTHRFGGGFTMSLKNNVGAVAKFYKDHNYMADLHSSPFQKAMIAEINTTIPSHLIIMDATKGFATQGPDKGRLIEPGIFIMSNDRVALDAVGVAVLRNYDTTDYIKKGRIFDLEQIKRAAELGIGVSSAAQIDVVAVDERAKPFVEKIKNQLDHR